MKNKTTRTALLIVIIVLMLIAIVFLAMAIKKKSEAGFYLANENYYYVKCRPEGNNSLDGNIYEYAIFEGDQIILKKSNLLYKPDIKWCNGIIRVETAFGTNHREIQYYSVFEKTFSESFLAPSVYADYISGDASESVNLFASFSYDENENTILVICDIFTNSTVATIHRDFIAPTSGANNIIFLNENIIFVDYDIMDDHENRTNNMEIILFGQSKNSIIVTEQLAD